MTGWLADYILYSTVDAYYYVFSSFYIFILFFSLCCLAFVLGGLGRGVYLCHSSIEISCSLLGNECDEIQLFFCAG